MGILNTATYNGTLDVYILKWDATETFNTSPTDTYRILLYTTYKIMALATSEPTSLLSAAKNATFNQIPGGISFPLGPTLSNWIITEVTSEQITGTEEVLFDVSITIITTNQSYPIETEITEDTPYMADISYSRGSPTSGTITARGTTFVAGTTASIIGAFSGYVMRAESWTDEDGDQWGKAYVTDYSSEYINRIVVGPYFFPGSNGYTKCYRDGSDHSVSVDTALDFLFGTVGLTTAGLPTGFGFHSGLNGEKTWIVSMQPISQIAQITYELTGLRPIWHSSTCCFTNYSATNVSNLRCTGSGQDYSSYRASVVGMGANGLISNSGSGYPKGYIVMPSITIQSELDAVVAAVMANCHVTNTTTYRGSQWNWNIGTNCLSAHMSIANKIQTFSRTLYNPSYGSSRSWNYTINQARIIDVEVILTDL